MPNDMHLKAGDYVILNPETWRGVAAPASPVWGSEFGYQLGRVDRVLTGSHNKAEHCAMVQWPTYSTPVGHVESHLQKASPDQYDFGFDFSRGVYTSTLWVLIRMTSGRYVLNAIETNIKDRDNPMLRHALCVTKHALPTVDNSDYNLAQMMLAFPDLAEKKYICVRSAINSVLMGWGLPELKHLPLPVREFSSIREAAKAAPVTNDPVVGLFTLPVDLPDLVINSAGE